MRKSQLYQALLLIVLITGCSRAEQETRLPTVDEVSVSDVDTGLVTHQPCAPPCWQGISPGMAKDEAIRLLQTIPIVDKHSLREDANALCWNTGCVAFRKGRVEYVSYAPAYKLELQQMIDLYGEPDGYVHVLGVHEDTGTIRLFWPRDGIVVVVQSRAKAVDIYSEPLTSPDSVIRGVEYFEPAPTAEDLFRRDNFQPPDNVPLHDYVGYTIWQGYAPLPSRR